MKFKLTMRVVSGGKAIVTDKVTRQFERALKQARDQVKPLIVERVAALTRGESTEVAKRYADALAKPRAVDVTDKGVVVDVADPVVAAMERGLKAFDMKPKLLARAKGGTRGGVPYVDVPFSHATGSVPAKIRQAMSRSASKTGATEVRWAGRTPGKKFTRLLNRGAVAQALGMRPRKQKVAHAAGVHDGIVRSGGGAGASYKTIRRVSAHSSPASWWNPGFKAMHVIDRALASAKRDITNIIRGAFAGIRS